MDTPKTKLFSPLNTKNPTPSKVNSIGIFHFNVLVVGNLFI